MDGNTNDINLRKELSEYRLEKAESCLVEAKALLEIDKYEGAANRSYYCMYHSIRSLLAIDGVEFKRHSGNMSYFREKYIKTKIFAEELSDVLGDAFSIRSDSDYGDFFVISKEEVEKQVENAELFYKSIKDYLDGKER